MAAKGIAGLIGKLDRIASSIDTQDRGRRGKPLFAFARRHHMHKLPRLESCWRGKGRGCLLLLCMGSCLGRLGLVHIAEGQGSDLDQLSCSVLGVLKGSCLVHRGLAGSQAHVQGQHSLPSIHDHWYRCGSASCLTRSSCS